MTVFKCALIKWLRAIRANPILNEDRVISAYKRHKNLKDYLVKGLFGEPAPSDNTQDTDTLLDLLIMVMESNSD